MQERGRRPACWKWSKGLRSIWVALAQPLVTMLSWFVHAFSQDEKHREVSSKHHLFDSRFPFPVCVRFSQVMNPEFLVAENIKGIVTCARDPWILSRVAEASSISTGAFVMPVGYCNTSSCSMLPKQFRLHLTLLLMLPPLLPLMLPPPLLQLLLLLLLLPFLINIWHSYYILPLRLLSLFGTSTI